MKQTLQDFGLTFDTTSILWDNTSAINLSKNPIQHSHMKHVEIRHHFLRDEVLKGSIKLDFVPTHLQLANIFTKPLKNDDFIRIRRILGICRLTDL